jgi:glycolate oxidase
MDAIDALRRELGNAMSVEPAALEAMRSDRSGRISDAAPLALVNARTITDVQATLAVAREYNIPVVPRGAGTGLAGGAIGAGGTIVLSLAGMNRILEIAPDDELAVVEAGVINGDLNAALAPHGLWFAPDPASRAISSVGGNIATNAGGLLCAKYGVTREAVLGLTVVLADGTLLRTGRRTVKGVTGYDLNSLFVGSEGTLGVIVDATVRVVPIVDGDTVTIGAIFPDVESAAAASAAITASRLRPAVMELLDAVSLAAVEAYVGQEEMRATVGLTRGGSYLLVQFDSGPAESITARAVECIEASGGAATATVDRGAGDRLIAVRRTVHPALAAAGEVLIEDVAVPRSKLPEMFAAITQISRRYDVSIPTVAHAGDGNLHPNFVFTGDEPPERVWRAADDLFRTALRLGGTLTGEHGVGVLKRRWLRDELGDDSYRLQRQLKAVFDPAGILNPAAMFTPGDGFVL